MKIGKRLTQLHALVGHNYDHIWDCCCDHGLLGMSLLKSHPNSQIHFVDIVPSIIQSLSERLSREFTDNPMWHTHCLDAGLLPINDYSGRHLIIISGVGGDLMLEMITKLRAHCDDITFDFLLCPVHHLYHLRQQLKAWQFSLIDEKLVLENKRFYELLLVSTRHQTANNQVISETGEQIWRSDNETERSTKQQYLQQTLAHYQRIQRSKPEKVKAIITAYQAVET
ncbi:SAM-dependent methyltransferase [Vibrio sp. SM6]|uniref:SAM-dependent methyltransferase n=2 Tax=Vibrio agarilyticus TaxID=2726741 RepID=A0A7X8TRE9_9VIBR|nr:SAM-dependent methyltransferase [Vibrio agarilyticus]